MSASDRAADEWVPACAGNQLFAGETPRSGGCPSPSAARGPSPLCSLSIEPPIFHAPAIVLAVDHDRHALELRLPASGGAEVVDDRPRAVFLQFLVDVPDQTLALLLVGFRRLLLEQLLELAVAVAGVVALRAA